MAFYLFLFYRLYCKFGDLQAAKDMQTRRKTFINFSTAKQRKIQESANKKVKGRAAEIQEVSREHTEKKKQNNWNKLR